MTVYEPQSLEEVLIMLVVLGLFLALLAPRLPRNPLLGVRVGYSFASPRVWSRVNREAGIGLAMVGVGGLLLNWLVGEAWASRFLTIALITLTVVMVVRAKHLLELESITSPPDDRESEPKPLSPVRIGWSLPLLISLITLLGALRVHTTRGSLEETVLLAPTFAVFWIFAILARRAPMFFHNPWVPHSLLARIMLEGLLITQSFLTAYLFFPHYRELPVMGSITAAVYMLARLYLGWKTQGKIHTRKVGEVEKQF